MTSYDWSIYDKNWYGYPPNKMGETLIRELHHYGDPVGLSWWPKETMPTRLEKHVYSGPLRLYHCQFIQRARFRGKTYILEGVKSRPPWPYCNGDMYQGLGKLTERSLPGSQNSRTDPESGEEAKLGIYGSPVASRRDFINAYSIIRNDIQYMGIAPLTDCPFDPDVVVILGNPRQITMAVRALMYYSGKAVHGLTGPGTCSSSWAAAFLKGEARYTTGCHGVFSTTGFNPNEMALSVPIEIMPTLVKNLELWRDRGKPMFHEDPPNEEREYIKVPDEVSYSLRDYKKPGYIKWQEKTGNLYETWSDRRRRKGLLVPEPV